MDQEAPVIRGARRDRQPRRRGGGGATGRSLRGLVLAGGAVASACGAGTSDARNAELAFEKVWSGPNSAIDEKRREVVRDDAAFARLWAEIHANVTPAPPPPSVDFAREMVIAVAAGTRPTGGFSIEVEQVVAKSDSIEVAVLESCPAQGAAVTLGLTQPVEVVKLARLTQEAKFKETRAPSCR